MRRIIKFFLCISTIFFLFTNRVSASVPYITRTLSADGKLIETQTAYTPLGNLFSYIDIVSPEDIFIDQKGNIYLADSGAKKDHHFQSSWNGNSGSWLGRIGDTDRSIC